MNVLLSPVVSVPAVPSEAPTAIAGTGDILFAEFTRLRAAVLAHLPRPAAGGVVEVTMRGVSVAEPGVSLSDLSAMLADITGGGEVLPEGLVLRDLRLRSLELHRAPVANAIRLDLAIAFEGAEPLAIAPDVSLRVASLSGRYRAGGFTAVAEATLTVGGHDIAGRLEMPAGKVVARVAPTDPAAALLADRGLVSAGGGHVLRELSLCAVIPLRRVIAYVALDDPFAIGPLRLVSAEGELTLGHGASAAFEAQLEIDLEGRGPWSSPSRPMWTAMAGGWRARWTCRRVPRRCRTWSRPPPPGCGRLRRPCPTASATSRCGTWPSPPTAARATLRWR